MKYPTIPTVHMYIQDGGNGNVELSPPNRAGLFNPPNTQGSCSARGVKKPDSDGVTHYFTPTGHQGNEHTIIYRQHPQHPHTLRHAQVDHTL